MITSDKHLASSDKRLAPCDKHLACDKRKAFTLLEVLVALAVLAAGAASLSLYLGAFRRISALEFSRSDSALVAAAYIDSLAVSLPPCADTVYTRRASLTRNPPAINTPPAINGNPAISGHPAINDPPEINNQLATNDSPAITITPVPATSLQWLEIRTPDYTFRRLTRCKKASR
ncbi:prepilin-type N-terminal cleavage/methylation domain-containing protein [Fibrobacter sp. UWR3]|uniref:prepilin-type N-terminal cleavage/methylation domain-containing protein n=1 Tax=Fibrobacter sp. UWR3 TaxID=1896217 RepID=UPI00091C407B|nr:prepilin-type N-terminal cleavage/methylation domain-containing protein [Fibrobacter sp. UWR3]SHM40668.1 prepilin-type N-terminal cleavage/methylation domain-containing protein [Fibrobacter sp. UWR3]